MTTIVFKDGVLCTDSLVSLTDNNCISTEKMTYGDKLIKLNSKGKSYMFLCGYPIAKSGPMFNEDELSHLICFSALLYHYYYYLNAYLKEDKLVVGSKEYRLHDIYSLIDNEYFKSTATALFVSAFNYAGRGRNVKVHQHNKVYFFYRDVIFSIALANTNPIHLRTEAKSYNKLDSTTLKTKHADIEIVCMRADNFIDGFVLGSGSFFAREALSMGKSARDAVQIAARFCPVTAIHHEVVEHDFNEVPKCKVMSLGRIIDFMREINDEHSKRMEG